MKKIYSYVPEPQRCWMALLQIALQGEFLLGLKEDHF